MKRLLISLVSVLSILGLVLGATYQQRVAATAPGTNYLVSSDASGNDENGRVDPIGVYAHRISSNGEYVVFASFATNLVPNDTNGHEDVFVKNTQTGAITLVSVSTTGTPSDGASSNPEISYDGRYVIFTAAGDDLVSGVSGVHLYRRDLLSNTTSVVDSTSTGTTGDNNTSFIPDISGDGRFATFVTRSAKLLGLVPGENAEYEQVVVKDMDTGTLTVISKNTSGALANQDNDPPTISCDGSIVTFDSPASNLSSAYSGNADMYVARLTLSGVELTDVTGNFNGNVGYPEVSCNGNDIVYDSSATNIVSPNTPSGKTNAYEYNRLDGSSTLISQNNSGVIGNASYAGGAPSVSDDGRFVAFESSATNLDTSYQNPYGVYGDIYVRDLKTSTTELVSITALGNVGTNAGGPEISADGSYVAYLYTTPDANNSQEALISGLTTPTGQQQDMYESKTGF